MYYFIHDVVVHANEQEDLLIWLADELESAKSENR
jgi:hypothetical protein